MKVINLKTFRVLKDQKRDELTYRYSLLRMEKAELLQELLNYHESYQRDPHDISVTLKGQHLMDVLEQRSHLSDLQDLARDFQHKLKTRLYQQMQNLK